MFSSAYGAVSFSFYFGQNEMYRLNFFNEVSDAIEKMKD